MKIQSVILIMCVITLMKCGRKSDVNSKNKKVWLDADSNMYHAKVMLDGKLWLTENEFKN